MRLPYFQDSNPNMTLLQNQWSRILNPLLSNPTNNCSILKNISLVNGPNVINHLLGRPLQGWSIVRLREPVIIYDTQDTNQSPELTLNLTLVNNVVFVPPKTVVDILVF